MSTWKLCLITLFGTFHERFIEASLYFHKDGVQIKNHLVRNGNFVSAHLHFNVSPAQVPKEQTTKYKKS